MTLQNEKFEEMISRQLTAELEPQRGKALATFRAHLAAEAAAPAPIPIAQGRSRRTLALWAGVPSLMAACIAVVVTLHFAAPGGSVKNLPKPVNLSPPGGGVGVVVVPTPKPTSTIVFDGIVTHDTPGNIIMNNNMPLREVHHQEIRQTQWLDPTDHSTMTITEPVEKVGYVQVQPY